MSPKPFKIGWLKLKYLIGLSAFKTRKWKKYRLPKWTAFNVEDQGCRRSPGKQLLKEMKEIWGCRHADIKAWKYE